MDNLVLNQIEEIKKINLRIKEYLWEKWYFFKAWINKYENSRARFLAR